MIFLQESIERKFEIQVNIHHQNGKYRLYIPKVSFYRLAPIVKPYFAPSMLYKLNCGSNELLGFFPFLFLFFP